MTRSPDSLIPSDAEQSAAEKRDDKVSTCRLGGEANLRAAIEVNAVLASTQPHQRSSRFSWSYSRGEPLSLRRSLQRGGVLREILRTAGTVYWAAARRDSPSN